MMTDYLKMSVSSIKGRGMRSWLTMIGIFIGIASVVALISLGQGLEAAITEQFNKLGTDVLIIQPQGAGFVVAGEDNPAKLTERDVEEISRGKGILEVAAAVFRSAQLDYKDEVNFQLIYGIPLERAEEHRLMQRISSHEIVQGRNLKKGDRFKALAGWDYTQRYDVFSEVIRPGAKLEINGVDFDIIGILKKYGNPTDDRQLVIPLETAEDVLGIEGDNNDRTRDFIVAQLAPGVDPDRVAETLERQLMNFRDLDEGEEDFEIQTAAELLSSFNTILGVVQFVLVGIAAISLLVGGIGIMNTMYTSVLERTKEIGVMKAIGARNSDIMLIFLIESGMLGLVGGIIGVILGFAISAGVTGMAAQFLPEGLMKVYFPAWLVFGGLGFSFVVGAFSGVLPAVQASKMDPVESLRYE